MNEVGDGSWTLPLESFKCRAIVEWNKKRRSDESREGDNGVAQREAWKHTDPLDQ